MSTATLAYGTMESPVGDLLVAGDGEQVHLISFPDGSRAQRPQPHWRHDARALAEPFAQLRAYFAGELKAFNLRLKLSGTPFQNTVWEALRGIPFGETMSYGTLAARIGRPSASRAVGAANGANPIAIVVPCHRVIGADRSLTGFGGGLATKEFLLIHEGAMSTQPMLL